MRTETAVRTILHAMPERTFVCANGHISRWAWLHGAQARVFPMLGSMGLAQSIALGVSLACPTAAVGILNGDGNLLMEPSATILVGARRESNLVHFCINNQAYQSTGGQPTLAKPGLLSDLARACGFRNVELVSRRRDLERYCERKTRAPRFCEVLVDSDEGAVPGRVETPYATIAAEIRNSILGEQRD